MEVGIFDTLSMVLGMDFMKNALLSSLLAAVACGLVGTLAAANRMLFLAGGVAHAAYGGVGLALFLSLPVLPVTLLFSIAAALLMSVLAVKSKIGNETLIGVLWAAGMAMGILFMDLTPGYRSDLGSYLFGNILAVSQADMMFMLFLDVLLAVIVFFAYQALLAFTFDRGFAASRGLPVNFIHHLLVIMSAMTVVMLIRVVGLLLVMALFTIPQAIAVQRAKTLWATMLRAVIYSSVFCVTGLLLATVFNLATGATIILVACAAFVLHCLFDKIKISIKST